MSKVPLVVGLQKVIQAIKNWLPFTPGENTTTYAPYGINFGTDTIVGIKGYRIIDMQPAIEVLDDATNVLVKEGGTYTLELEPGETIDERILNQEYTIYIKATSERVGVIEKIEGNVVTVKPFYWPNNWPDHVEDIGEGEGAILGQQYYYENSFFVCDSVPDAGNKYFGEGAYAEGNGTRAHGFVTHAEGSETFALGKAAHTEGIQTYAGYAGHAQNMNAKAIGLHSHAQNYYTTAKGDNSDAGGYGTKAYGKNSVTRGEYTEAYGKNGVANGWKTKAIGDNSDAGGFETETEGLYSFGRGYQNKAKHKGSALFGRNNTSSREMQFLAGQFADTSDKNIMAAVGVGTADNARKNGLAVYADGRVRAGKGGTSGNDLVTVDQLNNTHFPQTTKVISTSNSEGWYQIAKGSNIKPVSGIFKVTAQLQAGGLWSEIIFVASKAFNANGKVTIINEQSHTNGAAIDNIRLRYTNNTANSDVYVDVHCRNNNSSTTDTVTISVELLDSIKADKLTGGLWNLTDIIQEPSTGWTYTKQIYAKKMLAINSDGTGSIQTPSSPSDDNIANVGYVRPMADFIKKTLADDYAEITLTSFNNNEIARENIKFFEFIDGEKSYLLFYPEVVSDYEGRPNCHIQCKYVTGSLPNFGEISKIAIYRSGSSWDMAVYGIEEEDIITFVLSTMEDKIHIYMMTNYETKNVPLIKKNVSVFHMDNNDNSYSAINKDTFLNSIHIINHRMSALENKSLNYVSKTIYNKDSTRCFISPVLNVPIKINSITYRTNSSGGFIPRTISDSTTLGTYPRKGRTLWTFPVVNGNGLNDNQAEILDWMNVENKKFWDGTTKEITCSIVDTGSGNASPNYCYKFTATDIANGKSISKTFTRIRANDSRMYIEPIHYQYLELSFVGLNDYVLLDGTMSIDISYYDDSIAEEKTNKLDQRLSFLEGGLLEYNEDYNLEYTYGGCPSGIETGWCYYSPIEDGNPYTKVRLNIICTYPSVYSVTVNDITVSYIDGVSEDGTKRERLFTLDEATRQQIFDFVTQHAEQIYNYNYMLYIVFMDSYVDVRIIESWEKDNIIENTQIPYGAPTNLIFDCKDYKYLDFNYIDHPVEPTISVAKLDFKKEN